MRLLARALRSTGSFGGVFLGDVGLLFRVSAFVGGVGDDRGVLSHQTTVHDVDAQVLQADFTWDEWTHMRYAYLCARHEARFHPEQWVFTECTIPPALARLVKSVEEALTGDSSTSVQYRSGPVVMEPLGEVHTLTERSVDQMLLHLVRLPAPWLRRAWDRGLLQLLVLRRSELEMLDRMNAYGRRPARPTPGPGPYDYEFQAWYPVDEQQVVVEGLLEDVAAHVLAHQPDVAVTVEHLDGSVVYFAADYGLMIGEHPSDRPAQGDLVRLRSWRSAGSVFRICDEVDTGKIDGSVAEELFEMHPHQDLLIRVAQFTNGGEESRIGWAVWGADDLHAVAGWVLNEPDPYVDVDAVFEEELPPLVLERIGVPDWVRTWQESYGHTPGHLHYGLLGEDVRWMFAHPYMYRALQSDHPGAAMVHCPTREHPATQNAYWMALWDLLRYHLGWGHEVNLLHWWLRQGCPVRDRPTRLLRDIWYADGHLESFLAWHRGVEGSDDLPNDDWCERVAAKAAASGVITPYGGSGGWDPLHLTSHSRGPMAHVKEGVRDETVIEGSDQTVLLLPGLLGWYLRLTQCDRSKPVRVVVDWIGSLGEFKVSPTTGRWHATTEEIHLAGRS